MKNCAVKFHQPRKLSYRCSLKYVFILSKCSALIPHIQLQKLTSISCKEGDFTYTAAHSSPARNRIATLLPRELHLKFDINNVDILSYTIQLILQEYHYKDSVEVLTILMLALLMWVYCLFCYKLYVWFYTSFQGYHKRKAFLVGPGPMQSTATDFWTMIWEKKSHAIVMLGEPQENGEVRTERCFQCTDTHVNASLECFVWILEWKIRFWRFCSWKTIRNKSK